jgi:hypothetical protein
VIVLFTVLMLELPPFPSEDCAACTPPPLAGLPDGVTCCAFGREDGSDDPCWPKAAPQSEAKPAATTANRISRTAHGRRFTP